MDRTYVLTMMFKSGYGEKEEIDIQHLANKILDYATMVKNENNTSNRHLGLHFKIEGISVRIKESV